MSRFNARPGNEYEFLTSPRNNEATEQKCPEVLVHLSTGVKECRYVIISLKIQRVTTSARQAARNKQFSPLFLSRSLQGPLQSALLFFLFLFCFFTLYLPGLFVGQCTLCNSMGKGNWTVSFSLSDSFDEKR